MTLGRRIAVAGAVFAVAAATVLATTIGGGAEPLVQVPDGDPQAGKAAIERHGCTSCHQIPGLREPEARVGPSLDDLAARGSIAGDEPNTPEVLIRWLQDPQSLEPGTLMPDVGVSAAEARDIAAYLYGER